MATKSQATATPDRLWDRIGRGDCPPTYSQFSGPCLVMGTGRSLWDDLGIINHDWIGGRMAVNEAIEHYPHPVDHAVSLHPEYLGHWMHFRQRAWQGSRPITMHSNKDHDLIAASLLYAPHDDVRRLQVWDVRGVGAYTSGLFAVLVALMLGYDRIVLAGMPVDGSGHYYDAPDAPDIEDYGSDHHEQVWIEARDQVFEGRVTSLSGRTCDWLGSPMEASG